MRKLVTVLILVPLAILFVTFAVANREFVTISLDPFDSAQPAFAFKSPLFLLIFALLAVGLVAGGLITWIKQRKWRSRARRAEQEVRTLRTELAERTLPPEQAPPPQPLMFPPAA
jgi:uncharacterized membrane protein YciS (DUF1049 family)